MKRVTWRWIDSGEGGASWNMAIDEAILDAVIEGISPPTIRLYSWDSGAISIGRFQEPTRGIDLEACKRLNIPVVRRMTGGRGVLHGSDQTISIVVPVILFGEHGKTVVEAYRMLCEGFIAALKSMRLTTNMGACERRSDSSGDCVAARSQADVLTSAGEKLVGSAQCRRSGVLLQQSSFLHMRPEVLPEEIFLGRTGEGGYPLEHLDDDHLSKAFQNGFKSTLGIELEEGVLDEWEYERAGMLLASYSPVNLVDSRPSL